MKIIVEQIRYNKKGEARGFPQTLWKGYRGRFYRPLFPNRKVFGSFLIGIGYTLIVYGISIWSNQCWR